MVIVGIPCKPCCKQVVEGEPAWQSVCVPTRRFWWDSFQCSGVKLNIHNREQREKTVTIELESLNALFNENRVVMMKLNRECFLNDN